MPEKIDKVLLILAANKQETKKEEFIVDLCEEFGQVCRAKDLEVDWIDLYADVAKEEFDPVGSLHQKDAKIIEYRLKIKRADLLVFFHPVRYNSVPAVLKGFLDLVFASGFAFKAIAEHLEPLLKDKQAIVLAFSEQPEWKNKLFYNDTLRVFWTRGVFALAGIQGEFVSLSGLQDFSEKKQEKIRQQVLRLANRLNFTESWLDLF